MITLANFLEACNIELDRTNFKIHLAVPSRNSSPLEEYFNNNFDNWQATQNKKNFPCNHVVSLIDLGSNRWLFVGVYQVLKVKPDGKRYWYSMRQLPNQENLVGRIIVNYNRSSRSSYRKGHKIEQDCLVGEVLAKRLSMSVYPGHNNVIISYLELSTIISQNEPTWHGALSNVKGIYCITDTANGKQYIGKADGLDGIWQRWSTYIHTGHGDNKELKKLLKEKGLSYKSNFQYSLIEIADFRTSDDEINARESHWKQVLLTRKFGYNAN